MDRSGAVPAGSTAVPVIEVTIGGHLDLRALPRVGPVLDEAVASRPGQLVVDLSGCHFVDAAAIGLLLDVHRQLWRVGGLLTLRAPAPRLRRILDVARVSAVLHIEPGPAGTDGPVGPGATGPDGSGRTPTAPGAEVTVTATVHPAGGAAPAAPASPATPAVARGTARVPVPPYLPGPADLPVRPDVARWEP